jgi:hypothetical protein
MNIVIVKSHNPKKKYDAIVDGHKIVSFGAAGYSDYTINKDDQRRQNYIKRHSNENWTKPNVASSAWLSRFLLWEKKTLPAAILNANRKYNDIRFRLKT